MPLEIQIQKNIVGQDAGAVTVKLIGSLDTSTAPELEKQLAPVVGSPVKDVVFDLADLKRRKTTIYLCLPAARMATHARWLRLMILMALNMMERVKVKLEQPVLFVLDEFPAVL